jgi:hypothetical protein
MGSGLDNPIYLDFHLAELQFFVTPHAFETLFSLSCIPAPGFFFSPDCPVDQCSANIFHLRHTKLKFDSYWDTDNIAKTLLHYIVMITYAKMLVTLYPPLYISPTYSPKICMYYILILLLYVSSHMQLYDYIHMQHE